jgi:hypothetical protein
MNCIRYASSNNQMIVNDGFGNKDVERSVCSLYKALSKSFRAQILTLDLQNMKEEC